MSPDAELAPLDSRAVARRQTLEALAAGWLLSYSNASTRAAYARDLESFVLWCQAHSVDPLQAARTHLDIHARELEESGRSPATVARRLSALASFYAYAVDEGALGASPATRVRRPHVSDESPTLGLDQTELAAFLAASAHLGDRAHLLACLLALNGLRVSEACGAAAGDLETERGHRVLAVIRKRGKRARVPLAPRTIDALERYLAGRTDGPLLLADDYSRLDRHQARRIVRRVARTAGIEKRISPHSLRHSFVTLSLDAGVALRDVQDAAGHADPRTTRRYDRARQSLERHPTYRLAAYVSDLRNPEEDDEK